MRIKKVDSKSIILHEETEVKFKTAGNTREIQFSAGVNKKCPIQNISKDKYLDKETGEFDYISDLFAEELEIKDYVNNIQKYQEKMFDKHDVTTKKFETILKKVAKLDINYAAQLETYKERVDALAKKVLAVSELLAPQKLSLDKTAYADLLKNINLTYQKEVKVQESKLADLQEVCRCLIVII